MRRVLAVLLGGLIGIALLLGLAARWGAFDPPAAPPEIQAAPIGPPEWKETRRYSHNRVLIVEAVSPEREHALEIARWIVEPSAEAYDEVLVYVRAPENDLRTRRVQWTKQGGYKVLDY